MARFSLGTRLFLCCFLVSALLFSGTYFYLKGFNGRREEMRAHQAFHRALSHYAALRPDRQTLPSETEMERLAAATGLYQVVLPAGQASGDRAVLEDALAQRLPSVELAQGRYLFQVYSEGSGGRLVLLFPLAEFEQANADLLGAFLGAGLALLLLATIVSQLLAREIARPFTELRAQIASLAQAVGLDPPAAKGGDEFRAIAESYLEVASAFKTAYEHKALALLELETYRADLQKSNANLYRRLFQLKVLLSLWRERDQALDVKDFLCRFLETLLPGLPFEYGCVIIRPLAEMGTETIFAKKIDAQNGLTPEPGEFAEEENKAALWTDIVDPAVRAALERESAACLHSPGVLVNEVEGRMRPDSLPTKLTVLSLRLQQGQDPLGSVHFLAESSAPAVPEPLKDFLLSLSAQVSAQLHIQALSAATRLDPLTHLYNKGYLKDRVKEEAVRAARSRQPFSLLLLELHELPKHPREADEALRQVAKVLKSSCRGSDTVCRLGENTFAVLLADTALAGAEIFRENLRRALGERPAALGLAEFPTHGGTAEELLATAEAQLTERAA